MTLPQVELYVHYRESLSDSELEWLEAQIEPVLGEIIGLHPQGILASLEELEVSLINDSALAEVHGSFLGDASPTDVITFPHGEILVSVEMAAQRAGEYGKNVLGETFLYLIHGMLHLAGFDDHSEEDFTVMAAEQERIWGKFFTFRA